MTKVYNIIPVSKFSDAKTRLSPILSQEERENLLKSMLKDVSLGLKNHVTKVIVISPDENVLAYSENELKIQTLKEKKESDLNQAIKQGIDEYKDKASKILITPSDIPLINNIKISELIKNVTHYDMILAPSKGGGTSLLSMKPEDIEPQFGEYSYFKHLNSAKNEYKKIKIYDSFYLSLDINTSEDLGEIILHGQKTYTKKYIEELGIKVEISHGPQRLNITRN